MEESVEEEDQKKSQGDLKDEVVKSVQQEEVILALLLDIGWVGFIVVLVHFGNRFL